MKIQACVFYYQKFLNPLLKWKILDTKSLMEMSNYQGSYISFCEMLRNLKSKDLVHWEPLLYNKKRIIYLTHAAQKELLPGSPYFIDSEIMFHDAIVSNTARSFLGKDYFYDCELPHEYYGKNNWNYADVLDPDGILYGKNKNYFFKIALEVELTRKSKERIERKIKDYIRSEFFDSVIYVFNKKNIFNAYIKYLNEIQDNAPNELYKKGINQKIFLLLKEDLFKYPLDFSHCPLYVNQQERKFSEVIHAI